MMLNLIDKITIKFVVVGIINTILGISLMFIFYNLLNFSYWFSTSLDYFFVSIFSFYANKYFTFKSNNTNLREKIYFIINICTCYIISYSISVKISNILLANRPIEIQENFAMALGMCICTILNYLGQRYFVFCKTN